MAVCPKWIEAVEGLGDAKDNRLFLFFEGPVETVPSDEEASVIFIDIATIDAMVNPVVARRVEDLFQRAEFPDKFCVDPHLVQRI